MKKIATFFIVLALALFLTACTTKLVVERLERNKESDSVLVGPIYYLPKGQLDILVKRRLKKCETQTNGQTINGRVNI